MHNLKDFRKKVRITQLSLAQYLGVSKSLIWHVENGTRELPDTAWSRLKDLLLLLESNNAAERFIAVDSLKAQKKKISDVVEKARNGIRDCKINIHSVQKRLRRMQKAYESSLTAFTLLNVLEKEMKKTASKNKQREWVDVYQDEIKTLHGNNCIGTQAQLELRLNLLEAKERVYQDFINKYG